MINFSIFFKHEELNQFFFFSYQIPSHTHTRGSMNITGIMSFRPATISNGTNITPIAWAGGVFDITEVDATNHVDSLQLLNTNTNKAYRLNFDASKTWTGEKK